MYKSTKRKSDQHRTVPYDLASSSAKRRSSSNFVSPIVNLEESKAAIQKKNRSSILSDSITELSNLKDQKNNSITSKAQQQVDLELMVNKVSTENQKTNAQMNNLKLNDKIEKSDIMDNSKISSIVNDDSNSVQNKSNNQVIKDQYSDEDLFDSDFDRLFENSSLANKLDEEIGLSRTEAQLNSQLNGQSNNESILKQNLMLNDDQEICDKLSIINDGEELFDSDAINNESDFEQSSDVELNKKDILDKSLEEEIFNDDLPSDSEIDSTLIFESSNPNQRDLITQSVNNEDIQEVDFKTASGQLIKIDEQRFKRAAKIFGLV